MGNFRNIVAFAMAGWLMPAAMVATSLCDAGTQAGVVVHVDDDAPPGGNGLTWASAFTHLRDAIDLASNPASGISEIRIGGGIQQPDRSSANPLGSRDRNSTFHLVNGVTIRGGYRGLAAGNGEDPNYHDQFAYHTILSGDLASDDGPDLFENSLENAYQVVVAVDVDETAVLDAVVISGGRADGQGFGATPLSRDQGAGANVYFGGPQFLNCRFERNWNKNHGAVNDHGYTSRFYRCYFVDNYSDSFAAGLYFHHDTQSVAEQCTFVTNSTAGQGGGGYSRSMREARFIDCFFAINSAIDGGGLYTAPDSTTIVTGCIFDNNFATHGGGAYLHNNAVTIDDCIFYYNNAIEGGGVFINDGTQRVMNCLFNGNSGDGGGGGMWNAVGSPEISDCRFVHNVCANGGGAGIYNGDLGTQLITRCSFEHNTAIEGAGMYNFFADPIVTDCQFTHNSAVGGSFSVGGGVLNYFCNPVVQRCEFTRNIADLGGGGLYNEGLEPQVLECVFNGNRSFGEYEGWGGGIMNGYWTTAIIANCTLVGNSAKLGGGIFNITFTEPRIINCTIVANHSLSGAGGVHVMNEALPGLDNCVVWGNTPTQIEGDPIAVRYSCVEGGYPGPGNIMADPLLAQWPTAGADLLWGTLDDGYGDLRVQAGSACIDAGDSAAVPRGVMVDLAGDARFADDPRTTDTGVSVGEQPVVDIGAFEVQVPLCPADIFPPGQGDGLVNIDDLVVIITNWGAIGGPADIAPPGGNGIVNIDDLVAVIQVWGRCR